MAAAQFVSHCMELLAPLGAVRTRRMFGGWGLYVDDLFIALIAFERLYLKVGVATQPHFRDAGCQPFEYSASGRAVTLSYWTAPDDALESPAQMLPWARLAQQAALTARAPAAAVKPRRSPAPARAAAAGGASPPAKRRRPPPKAAG